MRIRTHIGVSVDGFISGADGWPAIVAMPGFEPGRSHGHPEFIAGCTAVVMGRACFDPALGAPQWPWPGLKVFVLTNRPLPSQAPADVVTAGDPAKLLALMQEANTDGDVHLVGGQRTIAAFLDIGAVDSYGVVILPILLGEGTRLTQPGSGMHRLQLESTRGFEDGSVEHLYTRAATPR